MSAEPPGGNGTTMRMVFSRRSCAPAWPSGKATQAKAVSTDKLTIYNTASPDNLYGCLKCHPGRAPLGASAGIQDPLRRRHFRCRGTWVPDRLASRSIRDDTREAQSLASWHWQLASTRRFGVLDEIVGRLGPPHRQRVLRFVIAGFPRLRLGDVVDIAGILREAAPRILHVMEIIRAQHVATETPALAVAFVGHAGGAEPDVVDRAYVPAAMMESRRVGLSERKQVMVAAVNAVHEGDEIRAVGQAQAERLGVKVERATDVRREAQDMREPSRPHDPGLAAGRRARDTFRA